MAWKLLKKFESVASRKAQLDAYLKAGESYFRRGRKSGWMVIDEERVSWQWVRLGRCQGRRDGFVGFNIY